MNREDQLYVLQWMLDFAEVDIGKLGPKELRHLMWDLDEAVEGMLGDRNLRGGYSWLLWRMSKEPAETYFPKRFKRIKLLQPLLRTFLRNILQKIKEARETEGQWLEIEQFNKLLYLADVYVKEVTLHAVIEAEPYFPEGDEEFPDAAPEWGQWTPGSLSEGIIRIGRRIAKEEHALISCLLDAMDGLPLRSLQECVECGRWFVQVDEKKRSYCSTSCRRKKANRDYQGRKKQTDPEAHEAKLAQKRENAHERYKEKVKRTHPNADVKRRPRRKIGKED